MKVLILSRSMGGGHNAAAKAVYEALSERGVHTDLLDAAVFTEIPLVKDASSYIYVKAVQRVPKLFGCVYHIGDAIATPKFKSVIYYANHRGAGKMYRYIKDNGYDAVVSPHLYPIETLTYLKRRRGLTVPCFGIATDYTCIPFWEDTEMDYYFTPGEEFTEVYAAKNMPREKMLPTGIPVSGKFNRKTEKSEAKKELDLADNKKYFLVMSGSMGAGDAFDVTRAIAEKTGYVPLVVCGSNKELREKMEEQFSNTAVITGFTDKIDKYMSASEAIFTKAGGLTSTEAAVFGIPIAHINSIPGCETENIRYFTSHGMSLHNDNSEKLVIETVELVENTAEKEKMLAAQKKYINPKAAADIADYVISLTSRMKAGV